MVLRALYLGGNMYKFEIHYTGYSSCYVRVKTITLQENDYGSIKGMYMFALKYAYDHIGSGEKLRIQDSIFYKCVEN